MRLNEFLQFSGLQLSDVEIQAAHGIPIELIAAMIMAESAGEKNALRFEKKYRWLHHPEHFAQVFNVSRDTERALQKFSYGLLQIMGATARVMGHDKHLLGLLDPKENLIWGCEYILHLKDRFGSWPNVVSAYNQGSPRKNPFTKKYRNQKYVDKVFRYATKFGADL